MLGDLVEVALPGYASWTNSVTVINSGFQEPVLELTIDVPEGTPCDADIDGSALVDGGDLAVVLGEWGSCPE